jgi:hypothetical protein
MIARCGSTTRKKTAALTFTETLSREITSCGSTSIVTTQVHAHHLLDARDHRHQARPLDIPEAAELEHHAAPVLAQDAQRTGHQQQHGQDEAAEAEVEVEHHGALPGIRAAPPART